MERVKLRGKVRGRKEDALPVEGLTMLMSAQKERARERARKPEEGTVEALREKEDAMRTLRDMAKREAAKEATGEATSHGKEAKAKAMEKAKVS